MYKVKLNHAYNPDVQGGYWSEEPTEGERFVQVATIAEASKACRDYITKHELGGGNWTGGQVFNSQNQPVAYISYNGRAWDVDMDKGTWSSSTKEIKFKEPPLNIEDLQFTHEDMTVINPLVSECGRFAVTPDNYGFIKQDDREDGMVVWCRPLDDGNELVLVNPDKSPFIANLSKVDGEWGSLEVFASATIEQLNQRMEAVLSGDPLAEASKTSDPALSR